MSQPKRHFPNAQLLEEISAAVENNNPRDVHSFLLGYLSAARNWARWQDGQQVLGSGGTTYRQLEQAVEHWINVCNE